MLNTIRVFVCRAAFFLCVTVALGAIPQEVLEDFYWVVANIQYDVEHDRMRYGRDFWQTPAETLELGRGDCEDLAIIFLELLHFRGRPSHLLIIRGSMYPPFYHVVVRWRDYVFDPSVGSITSSAALSEEDIHQVLDREGAIKTLRQRR